MTRPPRLPPAAAPAACAGAAVVAVPGMWGLGGGGLGGGGQGRGGGAGCADVGPQVLPPDPQMASEELPEGRRPLIQGLLGPADPWPVPRPLCMCGFHAWCVQGCVRVQAPGQPTVRALICPCTRHMLTPLWPHLSWPWVLQRDETEHTLHTVRQRDPERGPGPGTTGMSFQSSLPEGGCGTPRWQRGPVGLGEAVGSFQV